MRHASFSLSGLIGCWLWSSWCLSTSSQPFWFCTVGLKIHTEHGCVVLLSFLVLWWSEVLMVQCMPPRSSGSRVFWVLVSGDTERRGLTWLFVVVVAWSSLAPVVSKVFALPLAMGWGVNFLLHFDIILGKNPKMISPLFIIIFRAEA